jgi:hypothetical protein
MDLPQMKDKYRVMQQALDRVRPAGEVIVSNGLHWPQQRAYTMMRLRADYPGITFPKSAHENVFKAKR